MIDPLRAELVLADLVRIESINPELVPGGHGEAAIARYVADFLKSAGLEAVLDEFAPGRFNAVGVLRGTGGGKSLMFNGHLDTVGVAGMNDPFAASVEGGRLYGRGSEDMKSGVAAVLVAAEALAKGERLAGDLVVAAVADEEYKSSGTRAVVNSGLKADAAIVTEPTNLEVVTAHKGFVWAEVETRGRAAHGSRPDEGLDAICFMGRLLGEIERLGDALKTRPAHPLLGHGSVHASLITGGQELSSYPDRCRLSLERRLIPGEDAMTFGRELSEIIGCLAAQDGDFSARFELGYSAAAFETRRESPFAQTVFQAARKVIGPPVNFSVQTFWADSALLAEAGIEAILFGPGGEGMHSTREYVWLDSVVACAETLIECAQAWCGVAA